MMFASWEMLVTMLIKLDKKGASWNMNDQRHVMFCDKFI